MLAAAAASIRSCHVIPTLGGHDVGDPDSLESELSVVGNLMDSLFVSGGAGRVVVAPIRLVCCDLCFDMYRMVVYWWHQVYSGTRKGLQPIVHHYQLKNC